MKTEEWKKHWVGMPEFVAKNELPYYTVRVMLPKQPRPACKDKDFVPFVTVHFRKEGLDI